MRLSHGSLLLMAIGAFTLTGCASQPTAASSSDEVVTGAMFNHPVATLWIHGMACPQCSYNVDLQLKRVPGVESVDVDMSSGAVRAHLSRSNPPTREQLEKAIENTTFTLVRLEMPGDAPVAQ
jgi:copper chaperone CopZ